MSLTADTRHRPGRSVRTFPADPLLAFADTGEELAALLGVTVRTVRRWRAAGLSVLQADRAATALGRHYLELWPEALGEPVEAA